MQTSLEPVPRVGHEEALQRRGGGHAVPRPRTSGTARMRRTVLAGRAGLLSGGQRGEAAGDTGQRLRQLPTQGGHRWPDPVISEADIHRAACRRLSAQLRTHAFGVISLCSLGTRSCPVRDPG
jgi:hypothetical protein